MINLIQKSRFLLQCDFLFYLYNNRRSIYQKLMPKEILHEIAPLKEGDFLYIADRHKKEFDYPIHTHDVYELNFVAGAAGVDRIVGDSSETIGDLDLVLITSPNLEHVWA